MSYRYALFEDTNILSKKFGAYFQTKNRYNPSYNAAPSSLMPVVRQSANRWRTFNFYRWGLLPYWVTEKIEGMIAIQTKAESLSNLSTFRPYLINRRCLIPANGFYRWYEDEDTPYYFHTSNHALFAMAGLYSLWEPPYSQSSPSFCIITRIASNGPGRPDSRVPVVLPEEYWDTWLDASNQDISSMQALLDGVPDLATKCHSVSEEVYKSGTNGSNLMKPN
jgi:putative SOS response-associated peptidase YedK